MSTPEFHLPIAAPKETADCGLWLWVDIFSPQKQWRDLERAPAELFILSSQQSSRLTAGAKRIMDIVCAGIFLLIAAPMLAVLALLIVADSPGPVFFRHTRIGEDGVPFQIWKLRSMHVEVSRYACSPSSPVDERITRVGGWIRRLSLDELPQLINVLRGEMSLVGPRPEMAFIAEKYTELERIRLAARPGITGLWQISGARACPIHHNLQYDLYYIRHANLLLDIAILIRTVTAVIRGVGAV